MNEKGKARKLDDRKSGPAVSRGPGGSQSASLTTLGGPGMVHPHPNYVMSPAEGFHSAGGHLAYRPGLSQLMQMNPSLARVPAGLSGDLGPPLFMPSLNLGIPKPSSMNSIISPPCSTSIPPASSVLTNSKQKPCLPLPVTHQHQQHHQQLSSTSAPYVGDMMSYPQPSPLPAFRSVPPLKTVAYISPTSTNIPKPTPISMATHSSTKGPITKVIPGRGGQQCSLSVGDKQLSTLPIKQGPGVPGSSEVVMVKTEGLGNVLSQQYTSGGHYLQAGGSDAVTSSLSKMLMTSSQQLLAIASTSGVSSIPRPVSSYSGVLSDAYSVRSPLMAPLNPVTSGQPTSNNVPADTRLDRPPQPSAPNSPLTGGGGIKDIKDQLRLTTAEVASSIIISNPGLTGKHIAAMTNTTQQQQCPPTHHHHHHPGSVSFSSLSHQGAMVPTELLPPLATSLVNLPPLVGTESGGSGGWNYSSQHHNSNHHLFATHASLLSAPTTSSPLTNSTASHGGTTTPPVATSGGGAGQDILNQLQQPNGFKPRLDMSNIPQSSLAGVGVQMDAGMLSLPGQPANSSPRPRILRGKRVVDGSWKLDGQSNSLHSPGSPHKNKLFNLKKLVMKSPCIISGGRGEQPQGSPTISTNITNSTGDTVGHVLNHVCAGSRGEGLGVDLFGSPRKKPRKQNVVANDDQYATNVPDTCAEEGVNTNACTEVNKSLQTSGGVSGESDGMWDQSGGMKEVEVCYLAQLRRSPYPINGIYKLSHRAAHNHFRKYSDIKHREELLVSVCELAHDKSAHHRANGWKLHHFNSQLQQQADMEQDLLELMENLKSCLDTASERSDCLLDGKALSGTRELLQGNIDRSNRIRSHIDSTRTDMFTVLEHESQVMDILDKYSNFKSRYSSISPSFSSSSSSSHPPRSHS